MNPNEPTTEPYGDPTTRPFWEAARRHRLLIQRCQACGAHQFYPRPICLQCESTAMSWVPASGNATVYSMTTTRIQVAPDLVPPYIVAIVELDEGPRMLTNIVKGSPRIGDRVRLTWREREAAPPLPVFEPEVG